MTRLAWDEISRRVRAHTPQRTEQGARRAAVGLVLRDGAAGIELLFIRRAEHERDPWSGQVGFPGGRAEPGDADLETTAARETLEETAIDLVRDGQLLGGLDEIRAIARSRPVDLVIAPFVFRLLRPVEGSPSHEAVSLHWLSLETLFAPECRSSYEYRHGDDTVSLPCLRVGPLVIWGLTFRMFESLQAILEG